MTDAEKKQFHVEELRNQFIEYLERRGKGASSQAARSMGLSPSALSRWASDKYSGDNDKIATSVAAYLDRETLREQVEPMDEIPFSETSISKTFFRAATKAHVSRSIGIVVGPSGVGKTRSAKEYTRRNPDVILIECDATQRLRDVVADIHIGAGLSGNGTAPQMLREIITRLAHSGRLIIVDEAENLSAQALDAIRRVHDKSGVGVLYVGLQKFANKLLNMREQYEYMTNRVRTCTKLGFLDHGDTFTLANSVLPEDAEALADTLHDASNGVARVLIDLCKDAHDLSRRSKKGVNETMLKHIISERLI